MKIKQLKNKQIIPYQDSAFCSTLHCPLYSALSLLKNIPTTATITIGMSECAFYSTKGIELEQGEHYNYVLDENELIFGYEEALKQAIQELMTEGYSKIFPDIDDIKSKITSNTKAIVVINPNNPTGSLYPKDVLEQIVDIARQNDLIIFADEIYDRLVMDGKKHTAIASLAPDVFCVSMNGLSKSHRICGFRVGWMVLSGPKKNVKGYIEGLNMLANMRLCANVLSQHVIQTSLGGYQSVDELLIPGGRIYEQREFITNTVNAIPGLSAVKPDAGLYIFPKIDRNMYDIEDDEEFCLRLLKKEKVLLVPGKGFNWNEPDHFRIVYLPRVEELADLGNKIERVLSYYKR